MTTHPYTRRYSYEGILNFRDLGGYKTGKGRIVAWRCLFRSGELQYMTQSDLHQLKDELGITSVLDLQRKSNAQEVEILQHSINYWGRS